MTSATDTKKQETRATTLEGLVLQTERGITTIADEVVAKIAGLAVREVDGVHELGKQFRRLIGKVKPGETLSQGVNVEVGKREAAIDLVMVVEYGFSIPVLAQEVRDNVITRVETMTGLIVKEVNIEVDNLWIPSADEPKESPRVE